jgi:Polyketide cyclase / dehydrase and lipid transport
MVQTVQNSVFIKRSVDDVFAFVIDPTTTKQWQANLVRSEIVTPGPMGTGTRVLEVRRLGKSERQTVWEVTEYEPPLAISDAAYASPERQELCGPQTAT